jgi:beta-ureidopropionase / N-carbamoyl-L-amino-acid hydrolase
MTAARSIDSREGAKEPAVTVSDNPLTPDSPFPCDRPVVRINRDRLWTNLMQLKEIGAYDDASTGLRGVRRLALTDEDAGGRQLVMSWMREAGLSVRVDRIGNVYAERAGEDPRLPCVLMGSHIDTVATGGAFDGTLGVLGGIEVMRALNEAGIRTRRPIEVGFFTEEEGVRFGTDMLGSAVAAGRLTLEYAHSLTGADGATVQDELVRIGFDGDTPEIRPIPHAYIECHIEQGPILATAGVDIGIVTGVQAISWQRLTINGAAAHAGTTPIEARHDAGLAAAEVVVEIRRMCDSGWFGQLRGTVGNLALQPSQTNVIPAEAVLTVDLRNPHDDLMTAAEKHLAEFVDDLQQRHSVTATWERMAKTAMVSFHESIQDVIATSAETLGLPCVKAMSGAGHDAQEIAATCPTAMVFVAGEYGGISHTPREHSRPDACGNGIDVLANAILTLAEPVSSPAQMGPTT